MRKIKAESLRKKIRELVVSANIRLRSDVRRLLEEARERETNSLARKAIAAILENARIAKRRKIAICQDTGMPVVFLRIGNKVFIDSNITRTVIAEVGRAYKQEFFRASIQDDPLFRRSAPATVPAVVHTDIVGGDRVEIELLPKGFGSENKSQVKMFNPTAGLAEIEDFIVNAVREAGSGACPPYLIGVGIGGTQDVACLLAKKSLLGSLLRFNPDRELAALEKRLLKKINDLRIGAFGLKGNNTALRVKVLTHPTHIAGMPVAVNISCHALRSARAVI